MKKYVFCIQAARSQEGAQIVFFNAFSFRVVTASALAASIFAVVE
jgi:hypothetical protein